MNFKKTVLLACVLVAAIVYLTKVSEPRRRAEMEKEKLFAALSADSVARLEVKRRGVVPFTVVQGPGEEGTPRSWKFADLPEAMIDYSKVDGLVASLKGGTFNGPISDSEIGADFSVYGLDQPELTLVVEQVDGTKREVAFGKKYEFLTGRYAKVSGQGGLFLADESMFQSLNKGRSDIRNKQPINFKDTDVREAILETSLGRITISQPAVGEWKVLDPSARDGSKHDIEQLFRDFKGLIAEEYLDGAQARVKDFGLDKPVADLTVKLRDGLKESSVRVFVGEAPDNGGAYFTYEGAPSVFKVASEKVIPLRKAAIDLRERRLVRLSVSDIEKVVSAGSAGSPVDIQAAAMDWTVNGKISDPVFVEQFLKDLVEVRAVDFPREFPSDAFKQPFLTLSITKKKGVGGETVTLMIGKEITGPHGPVRYARLGEQGEVSLVRDVEAKRIVPHEEALVQKAGTPTPAAGSGR